MLLAGNAAAASAVASAAAADASSAIAAADKTKICKWVKWHKIICSVPNGNG